MEQLVNAVTPYYYAMAAFLFFGVGSIGFGIIIFIASNMTTKKELLIMLNLGGILIISGLYFSNICDKYNEQAIAIVKPVISENYPDGTDFSYSIDEGSFTENNIEYKIQYKKTVNNEEKLIITVIDEQSKDKNTKMLDIPKETKNNESTND